MAPTVLQGATAARLQRFATEGRALAVVTAIGSSQGAHVPTVVNSLARALRSQLGPPPAPGSAEACHRLLLEFVELWELL